MKTKSALLFTMELAAGVSSASALTVQEAGGWFESAYAKWTPVSSASSYNVYCDGKKIDDALIRTYSGYVRADIPGLSAGSHTIRIAAVTASGESGSESATQTVSVKAFDRTGFAFNDGHVPGAYNADGTLKSGAVVIYMSENTKNTATLDVTTNSKGTTTTCKSVQGILNCYKKGYEKRPLVIRILGNVTDSDSLISGDMLIDLGSSEDAYVTVAGIGDDATVNGWGIRLKNAMNVEIRNIGIMNVNSGEGDNIGLQQNNAYVWVHNNDFFYGDAGSDADQAKGDGALDCKKSSYSTFSYNHFWDNGKSNLLGLSEGVFSYETTDYYITYHHNWYDHSDSRHPRVRYYNAHVYNNYYDGNAKYGAGSTLGSSVFMEGNYFRNCKYPMLTSMQGSDLYAGTANSSSANATFSNEDGGFIKAYNNYMEGKFTFIPYGASSFTNKGSSVNASTMSIDTQTDFDAYVVSNAKTTIPASIKSKKGGHYYSNFDTGSKMYSYTAEEPAAAKTTVETYAGRMHGGDFQWTFSDSDDESYAVNSALKSKLQSYTGTLKSIQGSGAVIITSSSSQAGSSAASSSSVKPSSSSSATSSSSVKPSSSSAENPDGSLIPITANISHNFTQDALSSEYFDFMGSLSTSKGSISIDGMELTRCLKMESRTNISFTLGVSATVSLYFNSDFTNKVKVNGKNYTATDGVLSLSLAAGSYTVTKGDVANLFLIKVQIDSPISSSEIGSSSSQKTESSSSFEGPESSSSQETTAISKTPTSPSAAISYSANRLSIQANAIYKVDVFSANGQVVLHSANGQKEFSLREMPRGVYLVYAHTSNGILQQKIVK